MSLGGSCSLNIKCVLQTYILNSWSTAGGVILEHSGGFEERDLNGRSWLLMMGLWKLSLALVPVYCDMNSLCPIFSPQRTEQFCCVFLKSETGNQIKSLFPCFGDTKVDNIENWHHRRDIISVTECDHVSPRSLKLVYRILYRSRSSGGDSCPNKVNWLPTLA